MADHAGLVDRQFGDQAAAYVASAVHAAGEDLDQIAALLAGERAAQVLDLGCGGGHVALAVAPHVAAVTACDLSQSMLDAVAAQAAARDLTNLDTRLGRAEALPFADAAFDWVLSRYSAHHWADPDAGLREAARVLRPGGGAAFADVIAPASLPLDAFLQAIEFLRDPSHVRDHSRAEWEARLARAGLQPVSLTLRRLRLEFGSWVARMRPPETHVAAIRSLQDSASDEARTHFAIEPDGSFTVDTLLVVARRA